MAEPIIITGTPRSGLALVAGTVAACGGFGGLVEMGRPGAPGSFENLELRESLERPLLKGLGCDPKGHGVLPALAIVRKLAEVLSGQWRKRTDRIFIRQSSREAVDYSKPNFHPFISSQVAALLYPIWNRAYPKARFVIVRRMPQAVISSCQKVGYVKFARPDEQSWVAMVNHYAAAIDCMKEEGLDVFEIWPSKIIAGDFSDLPKLMEYCDLIYQKDRVKDFLLPIVWKAGSFKIRE